mgnify:CR=1 FL=1
MTKTTDEKTDGRKVIEALERSAAEKQHHRRTETPQKQTKAKRAFKNLTGEEEFNLRRSLSLRAILGGDILAGAWFRRHFWYIVMIIVMCLLYVGNRYACQQQMIEGTHLADTLLDRRYKALTLSGQLKEMTRRSSVEEHLADTTLHTSTTPNYNLPVEAETSSSSKQP